MRFCMLICCLGGVLSLGCGNASGPQARGIPANLNDSENSATPPGEPGPHHGSAARVDSGTGPEVRLDAITLTAPATWKRTRPGSSFYLAEFALPHVDKDTTDGRLMVSVGSGSMEANLDVFMGEFDTPSENARKEQKEIAGLQVTIVDISGGYTGQHSQSAPTATQAGYRMIVAVIPIGDQLYFVKAVGPQQTIASHVEAINTFVRSVQQRNAAVEMAVTDPGTGPEVRIKPFTLTAPATWKRTKPRSSLVQAEFAIPHADKDAVDGRLTVSIVSGTVKENVDRWRGQFVGAIDSPKQEEIEVGSLKATRVDFAGTYGEQAGMMAPVVNRPEYRMIAAIIPINDQLFVVKAVGPQQTIAANVEAIDAFVRSLKRDD
jgi:hypothetical protein